MPNSPAPQTDHSLIARLRDDLSQANWTAHTVDQLLSPLAQAALERDQLTPASIELSTSDTSAALLTRFFLLAEPLAGSQLLRVFPSLSVAGAEELGLLRKVPSSEQGDSQSYQAIVDLRPHCAQIPHYDGTEPDGSRSFDWWIASDLGQAQTGQPPKDDYVLGIASASTNLLRTTLRQPTGSALDLGCGCGILALYLSTHAERVVATDISERACQFTRFNASLNQAEIEVRQGSLFNPVKGETFDLITSNPPFVITPESVRDRRNLEYRDGGMPRDTLIPLILKQSLDYLNPSGTVQMLANWEVGEDPDNWASRPQGWIESAAAPLLDQGQDLDVWLVQRDLVDVAQYAEWWMRDAWGDHVDRATWTSEYRDWLQDFQEVQTHYVGLGSLAMRVGGSADSKGRQTCTVPGTLRLICEYLPDGPPIDGAAVKTALDNLTLPSDWTARPLLRGEDVREVRYFIPGSFDPELIRITQGRPGGRDRSVSSAVAALIGVSDGELLPSQVIPAIAMLLGRDEDEVKLELESSLPELLRSGTLQIGFDGAITAHPLRLNGSTNRTAR